MGAGLVRGLTTFGAIALGHSQVRLDLFVQFVVTARPFVPPLPKAHNSLPFSPAFIAAAIAVTSCCQRDCSEASCLLPAAVKR